VVPSRDDKVRLAALVVSGLAHAVFAAWLATRPEEAPRPKVVSVEFLFSEPPPPAPPPPEPTPPPEPEAPRPPPPRPPRASPKPPPAEPAPEVPPPDDVPRDTTPRDVPVEPPRLTLTPTSLVPSSDFTLRLDAGVTLDDLPSEVGTRLKAPERPTDLVGSLAKETLGRGRVDRGLVHPYYSQLGKALLKRWDADRVAKEGLKGLLEQTQANAKLYNDIWLERAAQYGGSGNPLGESGPTNNRRAPVNDRIQGLAGVDLEARKELSKQMRETFKATRRAIIRVVQDDGGKLKKVELVSPSNDEKVDREALKDVRAAAEQLPPPPKEALEGKQELSSLWSFELVVSISPPVPTFTFEFDEALGFVDMRLPLDRRIYKKVRLVSVE
jgi:TonB family protein